MQRRWQRPQTARAAWRRYGFAATAVVAALLLRGLVGPLLGATLPLLAASPAVALSAWYGGFGPGLATTVLSAVGTALIFGLSDASPIGSFLRLAGFVAVGALISWLFEAQQVAKQRAELSAREADQHALRRTKVEARLRASEQYHRMLAEAIPEIVWTARPDGEVDYINQRWLDFTGLPLERSLGSGWRAVVHPDDQSEGADDWARIVAAGRPYGTEYRIRRADGAFRWHLERGVPVRDERGRLLRWIGTCTDIEDQKRAEQASRFLADASTLLSSALDHEKALASVARLALDHLGDICVVDLLDETGSLRQVAIADADMARAALVQELRARMPFDPDRPVGIARVLRTGEPEMALISDALIAAHVGDEQAVRLIRQVAPRSFMIVPMAARGRTLGAMSFIAAGDGPAHTAEDLRLAQDLARRAAMAVDNALLYRQAQDANRVKDEFLTTLSHELRTPLNAMLGWARLLRRGELDRDTVGRALETIERNTITQAQLIEDLLDVSRIVTGRLRIEPRPVDLAPVLEAALEIARPAAEARRIELRASFDRDVGRVLADPNRLQQVVWNLLSNAVKFTPAGGLVDMRLQRAAPHARIVVRDTGAGIPAAFLPHVFERFRQVDSSSTRRHGGLGLGLAIVRHLVEMHGGSIRAESGGEGLGATFVVDLPLHGGASVAEPQDTADASTGVGAAGADARLAGLDVLVVDDDADARAVLKAMLESYGARVRTAASTADALRALGEGPPAVLLVDIAMPGEDGYALIRHVRTLPPERGGVLPAAAVTGYAHPEDRARSLAAGFQEHLTKPFDPAELAASVVRLARTTQAQSADGQWAGSGQ